jgi:hypothetical protein
MRNKTTLTVTLPDDHIAVLRIIAEDQGVSFDQMLAMSIRLAQGYYNLVKAGQTPQLFPIIADYTNLS